MNLQPRIYWWKRVHTTAIPINHKTSLFLMPHCHWNPLAFHQEMLKRLLKEGRGAVWGFNQKYPGPDLPDIGERGAGGYSSGGRWRESSGPHPQITVRWGVPRELWSCSEDAASSMELLHPTCVIRGADRRVGSSGISRFCSILINCYVHLV